MDIKLLSGANLAFIGDAYFDLVIREHVLNKGITNLDKLNKETIKYVSRTAQSEILNKIYPYFNQEEKAIYKRGRNYHYKDRDPHYIVASGFEAVIGYLYLSKQNKRLTEVINLVIAFVEGEKHE